MLGVPLSAQLSVLVCLLYLSCVAVRVCDWWYACCLLRLQEVRKERYPELLDVHRGDLPPTVRPASRHWTLYWGVEGDGGLCLVCLVCRRAGCAQLATLFKIITKKKVFRPGSFKSHGEQKVGAVFHIFRLVAPLCLSFWFVERILRAWLRPTVGALQLAVQ